LPELDRAYSTLIKDMQERGMLATTLVILVGEFGRTPEINVNARRDHWPNAFSLAISGAGIRGGQVCGATDENGIFVKGNRVQVPDLVATIYRNLGIDSEKEYFSNIGRPIKLADKGKPLEFLL
jgi:uncharacterized protein (DUF1501 family)